MSFDVDARATLAAVKRLVSVLVALSLLLIARSAIAEDMLPRQWRLFELVFTSSEEHASPMLLNLTANFAGPGGVQYEVPGFWDGGNTWRVRFAPPVPGEWRYRTTAAVSGDSGLDAQTGAFTVQPASGDNPLFSHGGFLRVSPSKRYLTYSDGTPFFWLGDTWWYCPGKLCPIVGSYDGPGESMFKTLVDERNEQGYTVAQMLFAGLPKEMPALFSPQQWRELEIRQWRMMDDYFVYANQQSIVPFIGIGFHRPLDAPSLDNLKLLWRYVVARYGAFAVGWLVAGEYNLGNNLARVEKLMALGQFIKDIDPYKRAMSIHPQSYRKDKRQAWDQSWYDFIMLQCGHKNGPGGPPPATLYLDIYQRHPRKPLLEDECDYEGISDIDAQRVRLVAYRAIQAGSFGFTYGAQGIWHPLRSYDEFSTFGKAVPWWVALAHLGGAHMGHMRRLYESVDWWKLEPRPGAVTANGKLPESRQVLVKAFEDDIFLIYIPPDIDPDRELTLQGTRDHLQYNMTWFNPRVGKFEQIPRQMQGASGKLLLPSRPDGQDWGLVVRAEEPTRREISTQDWK